LIQKTGANTQKATNTTISHRVPDSQQKRSELQPQSIIAIRKI
jgi:hypothetical protein